MCSCVHVTRTAALITADIHICAHILDPSHDDISACMCYTGVLVLTSRRNEIKTNHAKNIF